MILHNIIYFKIVMLPDKCYCKIHECQNPLLYIKIKKLGIAKSDKKC